MHRSLWTAGECLLDVGVRGGDETKRQVWQYVCSSARCPSAHVTVFRFVPATAGSLYRTGFHGFLSPSLSLH